ncbi:MAG: carboxypeptidase-like regulatory domain-containing protein [Thermogemmata sp.]|nr:carboxypeptidase-like regulatory domain-containing protein [Thermogemmata sp.]
MERCDVRSPTWMGRAPATLGLLFVVVAGCQQELATVQGHVHYQGQPVPGGSLILYCDDGQIVRGLIGPNGYYRIENVPYGTARVAIQAHHLQPQGLRIPQNLPPVRDGPITPPPWLTSDSRLMLVPARYSHPEESGLTVSINQKIVEADFRLLP